MDAVVRRKDIIELRNGKIVDVIKGSLYPEGTRLVIQGDRILAMPGLPGEPDHIIPDLTIDLQGKTVMPGLINTHCHIQMVLPAVMVGVRALRVIQRLTNTQIQFNLRSCLEHGITTVRDTWAADLAINTKLKDEIESGRLIGPRIIQSILVSNEGGAAVPMPTFIDKATEKFISLFLSQGLVKKSSAVVFEVDASEQTVRAAVDRAIDEYGAQTIKLYEQPVTMLTFRPGAQEMHQKQMNALVDQARRRGVVTTIHTVTINTFRRAVEAGVTSLAHLPLDGELSKEDIENFIRSGCILEPTLSVAYTICYPLPIKGNVCSQHPEMLRLHSFRESIRDPIEHEYWLSEFLTIIQAEKAAMLKNKLKLLGVVDLTKPIVFYSHMVSNGFENLRKLKESGGVVAFGNDGGISGSTPAMAELEVKLFQHVFAERGRISGTEILRIATINSAKALGIDNHLGSLETGKLADLILIDGNPLTNPEIIGKRPLVVFKAGKMVIKSDKMELIGEMSL